MKRKHLTIILVPSAKARMFKVRIPYKHLNFAIAAGMFLLFALAFVVFKYVSLSIQVNQLEKLSQENSELNHINSQLQTDVDLLAQRIESLDSVRMKIYKMLNITSSEFGVGSIIPQDSFDPRYPKAVIEKSTYLTEQLEKHYNKIEPEVKKQIVRLASIPSMWPARGYITSYMGYRTDPFTKKRTFHPGIDIVNSMGTPILAPADGIVVRAEVVTNKTRRRGLGNVIILEHRFGYKTTYGHLDRIIVKKFQRVKCGDIIGYMGNTGRSTSTHLHYEVKYNGARVNPMDYVLN